MLFSPSILDPSTKQSCFHWAFWRHFTLLPTFWANTASKDTASTFHLEVPHLASPITFEVFPLLPCPSCLNFVHPPNTSILQHLSTECEFPSARRYQHVSVDCVCNTDALGKRQTECCLVTDRRFPQFWANRILSIAWPRGATEPCLPFTMRAFKGQRSSHP